MYTMGKIRTNVYLSETHESKVKKYQEETGMTRSGIIREALQEFLEKHNAGGK